MGRPPEKSGGLFVTCLCCSKPLDAIPCHNSATRFSALPCLRNSGTGCAISKLFTSMPLPGNPRNAFAGVTAQCHCQALICVAACAMPSHFQASHCLSNAERLPCISVAMLAGQPCAIARQLLASPLLRCFDALPCLCSVIPSLADAYSISSIWHTARPLPELRHWPNPRSCE